MKEKKKKQRTRKRLQKLTIRTVLPVEFLIKMICKNKKCGWLKVASGTRSRGIFNFINGDVECVYTDGAKRENIRKYRKERECQGHTVPVLVGGNYNN